MKNISDYISISSPSIMTKHSSGYTIFRYKNEEITQCTPAFSTLNELDRFCKAKIQVLNKDLQNLDIFRNGFAEV
jgi:hypothetical protein